MKLIITIIAVSLINFALSGYALYQVSTFTKRANTIEQTVATHDRVLLQIVCATRVSGIIDLDKCIGV